MSAIAANDISMVFKTRTGRVHAIDRVTVEIPDAHFACIVGASGCGKSTLLNVMGGLVRPTSGNVYVDGRAIHGPGTDRGMVFQSYTLFPWLRVRENVEFGPRLKGMSTAERRRISGPLLEEMGLSEFARAYPKELSGGMKQRVAIARALANDPKVLLMDEPFGALDALTRASAQRFLTEIWEQHRRTIAFVTHDIEEAIFLGDTVFVMSPRPGRLREVISIDIPRPRTLEAVGTPRFGELKQQILELIVEHENRAPQAVNGA
ncbi:MAG TPA: ABC transporter ATP-binding protein [Gaiellaceae bacterium]|nr:ABC transporter ATP-binding protein [Gaiellaceae bacterium]